MRTHNAMTSLTEHGFTSETEIDPIRSTGFVKRWRLNVFRDGQEVAVLPVNHGEIQDSLVQGLTCLPKVEIVEEA